MYNPVSTYRIQFNQNFKFKDLRAHIPYLHELGIKTIYASPIFEATPGSNHGYDVVNPHKINPEIGTIEEFKELRKELVSLSIGWIQDIVPNHMAFHSNNLMLTDVLEKGLASVYAAFFDIAWTSDLYNGRLMVPFLGASLEEVIRNGEIKVANQDKRLVFKYYENVYPVNGRTYSAILQPEKEAKPPAVVMEILNQLQDIRNERDLNRISAKWEDMRLQLEKAMQNEGGRKYIENCLDLINRNQEKLLKLANQQEYQLCYWQETDRQINYRRFFTINGLICLNIHHKEVFDHCHVLVKYLLQEKLIDGLRIDHIDGLYDPGAYLEQLREVAGEEAYIVVEKILEPGEALPEKWPIQGSTGYDFLSQVNNLLTRQESEGEFTKFYQSLTKDKTSIHQQIREKKTFILKENMAGELENLYQLFVSSNLTDNKAASEPNKNELKEAIGEVLIQCPVYRFYGNKFPLEKEEHLALQDIFKRVRNSRKHIAIFINLLEQVLSKNPKKEDESYNKLALHFYRRLMQFSGPLMAKGVEDTLMYTYNRCIAKNEVGDSPEIFGISAGQFHNSMLRKWQHWKYSANGTATHDTKRGEDASARLNVLTDIPEAWIKTVKEWQKLNENIKQDGFPDTNDEYFIYQALLASYPMPGEDEDNFPQRFKDYLTKALREAKRHSNWTQPDEKYESAALHFADQLLDKKRPFWKKFESVHQYISDLGILNSLSKVLLKLTCPGIPDVYQGTESWDLSMVDPDNRRPVNFGLRKQWLKEFAQKQGEYNLKYLWEERYSGKIKQFLLHKILQDRTENPEIFTEGHYHPVSTEGKYKNHLFAFARQYKTNWYLIAIPLHTGAIAASQKADILSIDWKDTRIILPPHAPDNYESVLNTGKGNTRKGIPVKDIFSDFPLAILRLEEPVKERNAGILMHISSLPSAFGVGDLGPESRFFADFLSRSRQQYWQMLPLNPTELGMGHSPYSSISSMAGNTLLLSPEELQKDGLLEQSDLEKQYLPKKNNTDYKGSEKAKSILYEKAFRNYLSRKFPALELDFKSFCKKEAFWLDDYALFVVLKQYHSGKAWFDWKKEYKLRESEALKAFAGKFSEAIEKTKWLQFLFFRQWKELRSYCNSLNIQLFGDLPFYVSYDSADVWSNPDIFSLDKEGRMIGVAGVPPDYFNSNGQLWGMPVFRWEVLKKRKYDWWVQRLRKNMELYDVLRLDHFRAFADYWEVPAGEKTAINGEWKIGPGIEFFQAVKKELGDLPFIAEDLGDINEGVHKLRDDLNLPGMKVLQFAFGDDMPGSIYVPHNHSENYIVYTGTHDNNTTTGWYRKDSGETERKNLEKYTGLKVQEKNVHLVLGRLAYSSVAKTAILPIQDVLGLNENARMNTPASVKKNWLWRLTPGQITWETEIFLNQWSLMYNR